MKISKRDALAWFSFFAQLPEDEPLPPRQQELPTRRWRRSRRRWSITTTAWRRRFRD